MINLGLWQLSRYHEKVDFNKTVSVRISTEPQDLITLLTDLKAGTVDPSDLEWLNVSLTGRYLDDQTILAVNRSQDGMSGVDPLTPLMIDNGSEPQVVLVNRGFISQTAKTPSAPSGNVNLIARIRVSETRRFGELSDPSTGFLDEVINIDLQRISKQIKNLNDDIYLEVLSSQPKDSPTISKIAEPVLSTGSHLSYTFQWFIFSIFVAAGWVVVVRRKLKSG